jgi:hypothetical protein
MYKITQEMLKEFQRVMEIRPQLYHDFCIEKHPHLLNEDESPFQDDSNNDAANCLLLSKTAEMIYLSQQKQTAPYWNFPQQAECEAVAIYKGRGKEKVLDWQLAIELNDGNFCSYHVIYSEENKPKLSALVVLETIEYYLSEAGLYEKPKWQNAEDESAYIAQFKDFEKV